ncbi:MAG: hypothetical protein FJX75_20245 [Armatimonadetes bacterium]|nr:hypothetical protein [Armatimonadota bacterium]
MRTNPVDLVSFCGGYCGKCGISGLAIGLRLETLQALLGAADFRQEAEHLGWPLMRDIATRCCEQFDQQAASFGELAGRLFPTHCRDGCVPPCEIARCCLERSFTTCAECADLDACERFTERHAEAKQNLAAIRAMGLEAWAKEQYSKAVNGWREKLVGAVDAVFDQ